MSARPSSDSAAMTMNSFNTSRPAGQVLVSFTANTTDGNIVTFNISTLTPGKRYMVNVSGVTVDNPIADTEGKIGFNYSSWPAGVFTVVEDTSYVPITAPTPTPAPSPQAMPQVRFCM